MESLLKKYRSIRAARFDEQLTVIIFSSKATRIAVRTYFGSQGTAGNYRLRLRPAVESADEVVLES